MLGRLEPLRQRRKAADRLHHLLDLRVDIGIAGALGDADPRDRAVVEHTDAEDRLAATSGDIATAAAGRCAAGSAPGYRRGIRRGSRPARVAGPIDRGSRQLPRTRRGARSPGPVSASPERAAAAGRAATAAERAAAGRRSPQAVSAAAAERAAAAVVAEGLRRGLATSGLGGGGGAGCGGGGAGWGGGGAGFGVTAFVTRGGGAGLGGGALGTGAGSRRAVAAAGFRGLIPKILRSEMAGGRRRLVGRRSFGRRRRRLFENQLDRDRLGTSGGAAFHSSSTAAIGRMDGQPSRTVRAAEPEGRAVGQDGRAVIFVVAGALRVERHRLVELDEDRHPEQHRLVRGHLPAMRSRPGQSKTHRAHGPAVPPQAR